MDYIKKPKKFASFMNEDETEVKVEEGNLVEIIVTTTGEKAVGVIEELKPKVISVKIEDEVSFSRNFIIEEVSIRLAK